MRLRDSFDLVAGCKSLLATRSEDHNPLGALDRVRVFSMALVIIGHTLYLGSFIPGYINYSMAYAPSVRKASYL